MKKTCFGLLFFLFPLLGFAQTYFAFPTPGWKQSLLASTWNGYIFDNTLVQIQYSHDTILNGVTYTATNFGNDKFIRQEGGKLYYLQGISGGSTEKILYDFSANVGDTIQNEFYSQDPNALTVIKKEKLVNPTKDSLWYLEIRRVGPITDTIRWLEGVGDMKGGLFQILVPDGSLAHICTLNKLNQTISANTPAPYNASNPIQQNWNCDFIHGQDKDNDGYRNHIPQTNTLELANGVFPPKYITSAIHRECDTLVIDNQSGYSLLVYDGTNSKFMQPNSISSNDWQNQQLVYYGFSGVKKIIVTHQFSDVYYEISVLGCETQDCDDMNAGVNAGQAEVPYNGLDDDCNPATLDDDLDQDGFGVAVDCDDQNADVFPGQTEIVYNGIDDDCNPATIDDDLDQDGFVLSQDCDDQNAAINPDQTETPYNGIDDDCNPATLDDDLDQDGFVLSEDCNDQNAAINPDQTEVPYNGLDDDCDPATLDDDLDQDGFVLSEDCDDQNAAINPMAVEIPNNGIDEDCDGMDLIIATQETSNVVVFAYPNPTSGLLYIRFDPNRDLHFTVFDLPGRQELSGKLGDHITLSSLPSGMYLLQIEDQNSHCRMVQRIILEK